MRWVDWKYMKENEDHYPGVFDSFKACGVDEFVGQKFTNWNDELVMQFTPQLIFILMAELSGCLKVRDTNQLLRNGPI